MNNIILLLHCKFFRQLDNICDLTYKNIVNPPSPPHHHKQFAGQSHDLPPPGVSREQCLGLALVNITEKTFPTRVEWLEFTLETQTCSPIVPDEVIGTVVDRGRTLSSSTFCNFPSLFSFSTVSGLREVSFFRKSGIFEFVPSHIKQKK